MTIQELIQKHKDSGLTKDLFVLTLISELQDEIQNLKVQDCTKECKCKAEGKATTKRNVKSTQRTRRNAKG